MNFSSSEEFQPTYIVATRSGINRLNYRKEIIYCIDTANESADSQIIEKLLCYFCDISEKECFCATLYTCYAHISPDVILELGWFKGYHNFIMPFLKDTHTRIKALEDKLKPKDVHATAMKDETAPYANLSGFGGGVLMLENGPGMLGGLTMNGGIDMSGFGVGNGAYPHVGMHM